MTINHIKEEILEHFRKKKLPIANCVLYKDGHYEHYMPDTATVTTTPPAVNPNSLEGRQPPGTVTWSLVNNSGDIQDHEKESMAFALGITQWGVRLGITFSRVRNVTGMIPIRFLQPGTTEYMSLFPNDNILAVTYFPIPENGPLAGHMFFNDDMLVIWSLDGKPIPCSEALASGHSKGCPDPNELIQTLKLTTVGRHEFGHALGMQHFPASPHDTMYPYYDPTTNKLGDDEVALAQSVYGKRNIQQTYIDSIDAIVATEFP